MFRTLSEKLEKVFKKLRGRGLLTEADVDQALREIRLALLEADVHYRVAKELMARVRGRAVGQEVLQSLTPGQQVVKIVHEELTRLLGGTRTSLGLSPHPPTVFMLVGLQGSGKTTTAAKLAHHYRSAGRRILLVAADTRRPAAVEQLQRLGNAVGVPVHAPQPGQSPEEACQAGVVQARSLGCDAVILDTAGRFHADEALMAELVRIRDRIRPHAILLVADAMTGQEAVNIAQAFDASLDLTGIVLTKLDGDARGGAALSMRAVTGKPVLFVGVGEKVDQMEPFHPDRIASRILGMGDVLTLIERAEQTVSRETAASLARKIRGDGFTLEDFRDQVRQIRRMGSLQSLLDMLPGAHKVKGLSMDERELVKAEAIINAMTPQERHNPLLINGSRRLRIARGSGTTVNDVNRLLKQFQQTRKLMKLMTHRGPRSRALRRWLMPG